ncbi:MAG TPA: cation:proton antiporter, partial [Roseiflexaceae bacterium]|nr:cation:proton antiporter [Roseiflexaceae bacterium]
MIIAVFILLLLLYCLVSCRLDRTVITAPILFTTAGLLICLLPPELSALELERKELLHIAEVGLVMLLFTDAAHINLGVLRGNRNLPVRLLSVGMLLTILLGVVFALLIFDGMTPWEAGILAAILAPTDAGLGQVIVNSPRVPLRIRQALNVEAGVNDGLSVPFLMLFIALAVGTNEGVGAVLTKFLKEQLAYGTLVGLAIGLCGGWLLGLATRRNWMAAERQTIGL